MWTLWTVPLEWQTGVVGPLFKKEKKRGCSSYRGITLLRPTGKVYAWVLEQRICELNLRLMRKNAVFTGRGLHSARAGMGICPTSPPTSGLRIPSLLFADNVVLLASLKSPLTFNSHWDRMRISTFKSEEKPEKCCLFVYLGILYSVGWLGSA